MSEFIKYVEPVYSSPSVEEIAKLPPCQDGATMAVIELAKEIVKLKEKTNAKT